MEMNNSEIREWLHSMGIYDYDICDGVVHAVGDVTISNKGLLCIPVQFGYVSGHFRCTRNNLVSLHGCPSEVGGSFYCYSNQLTSLEGCPNEVGKAFNCVYNNLTSLEGCPSEVGGHFNCYSNQLASLECGPEVVGGNYYCVNNLFEDKPDTSGIKIGGAFRWK
jgi:hypothetical protein